jgi:hypothetical protein
VLKTPRCLRYNDTQDLGWGVTKCTFSVFCGKDVSFRITGLILMTKLTSIFADINSLFSFKDIGREVQSNGTKGKFSTGGIYRKKSYRMFKIPLIL